MLNRTKSLVAMTILSLGLLCNAIAQADQEVCFTSSGGVGYQGQIIGTRNLDDDGYAVAQALVHWEYANNEALDPNRAGEYGYPAIEGWFNFADLSNCNGLYLQYFYMPVQVWHPGYVFPYNYRRYYRTYPLGRYYGYVQGQERHAPIFERDEHGRLTGRVDHNAIEEARIHQEQHRAQGDQGYNQHHPVYHAPVVRPANPSYGRPGVPRSNPSPVHGGGEGRGNGGGHHRLE